MLKRQNEMNEAEEAARPSKLKLVDHDDQTYVAMTGREIASISMLITVIIQY